MKLDLGRTDKLQQARLEEFLTQIEDCLNRLDELPERAYDFVESVRCTLEDLSESARTRGGTTTGMRDAVDNIEAGIARWEDRT